ncbi:hypothetical protein B566_EDAN011852 [Ephemera danica]|nr:hypothetical protein B566_EDAN011852 [Ephemera danica]
MDFFFQRGIHKTLMIGSFWNLCRACPSMPVDKRPKSDFTKINLQGMLHSEYRSTYRWHEYTGPRQEVVRRPPQPSGGNGSAKSQAAAMMNQCSEEETSAGHVDGSGSPSAAVEPALSRKKKHPELAYKTHEFLAMSDGGSDESLDSTVSFDRARVSMALLLEQLRYWSLLRRCQALFRLAN